MSAPIISVVMPVFNAKRYVACAIQSVLDQTFRDFELILVDDGSTDGTANILRDFAPRDDRIKLIHQQNAGPCNAANTGLAIARGEFYARMDHDDIALPERFSKQVEFLRGHTDCAAVGTQVMMVDSAGLPLRIPSVPLEHEEIERLYAGDWPMFHPTLMTRLHLVREVGCYRDKYRNVEDLDLYIRLAEHGRLANLPMVLLKYRQHMNSLCYSRHHAQAMEMEQIFREASERRGQIIAQAYRNVTIKTSDATNSRRQKWSVEKMWAWWALSDGFVRTARRHSLQALKLSPLSRESWLLMWCALRGH